MITKKIRYYPKNLKKNEIVLDIETTGLSPLYDKLVLLGIISYDGDYCYIYQFFAQTDIEEKRLLEIYLKFIKNKKIITYNGDTFDLPFLNTRLVSNKLDGNIFYDSFDIYKIIRSKKYYIDFSSMKLMHVEKLLDINRNDPSRYKTISKLTEEIKIRDNPYPILKHNQNDLASTEKLIDIENIIKDKLSVKYNGLKISLTSIFINNDIARVELETNKDFDEAYFSNQDYQLKIINNKIIIYFTVLYGKISPKVGGIVTRNIFNLKNESPYKISSSMIIIREGKMYNYKNILNLSINIIKENLEI